MACSLEESFLARILFRRAGTEKGETSPAILHLDDRIAWGKPGGKRSSPTASTSAARHRQEVLQEAVEWDAA
jgi:hypothetical protein